MLQDVLGIVSEANLSSSTSATWTSAPTGRGLAGLAGQARWGSVIDYDKDRFEAKLGMVASEGERDSRGWLPDGQSQAEQSKGAPLSAAADKVLPRAKD